jgi:hypothetical protein
MSTDSLGDGSGDSTPASTAEPTGDYDIPRWIKTDCGRLKYQDLATRRGLPARLRLGWFVLIAALRDWRLPDPDQPPGPQDSPPAGGS